MNKFKLFNFIAFLLLLIIIVLTIFGKHRPTYFVDIVSLFFCLTITLALGIISFGLKDCIAGICSLRVLIIKGKPSDLNFKNIIVVQGLKVYIYVSTIIYVLINIIHLSIIYNTLGIELKTIIVNLGLLLLSPLYAIFISECTFRPAMYSLKYELDNPKKIQQQF